MSNRVKIKGSKIVLDGTKYTKIGVIDEGKGRNIEKIIKNLSIAKLFLIFFILIVVLSIVIISKFYK